MSTHTLALVTIGQAPRHDYDADLPALLPPRTTLVQHGALDEIPTAAAASEQLAPSASTKQVLVSRMRDGAQVTMDGSKLAPLLEACVRRVAAAAASPDAILLLCTGDLHAFPGLGVPLVAPQPAVRAFFEGRQRPGTRSLIVVSPEARQAARAATRWEGAGGFTVVAGIAATPYGDASAGELEACAEQIKALKLGGGEGDTLVYMDCMGYTLAQKQLMSERTGLEVVVPREVVFKAVGKLFGEL
ncbi:hypothetical protein BD626DRAFT_567517 [Schizophyllum amplum]|uniref:AroM protein n=1 Tax=Schizophyllum amplum TaxID=97359 RepID=A0A550CLD1_9AGAR|nr:hypothetical protein BD626DRAFT_567517 [Auriculariopsis ampla]